MFIFQVATPITSQQQLLPLLAQIHMQGCHFPKISFAIIIIKNIINQTICNPQVDVDPRTFPPLFSIDFAQTCFAAKVFLISLIIIVNIVIIIIKRPQGNFTFIPTTSETVPHIVIQTGG